MKRLLQALFLSLFMLILAPAYASHIEAGDLTFACIGPHQYQISLTLYRDCHGITMPTSVTVNYSSVQCGVSDSVTLSLPTGFVPIDVTDTCPGSKSYCDGGTGYGVQKYTYSNIINLPAGCGTDWVISYQNCCRNAAITTINNPGAAGLYIKATLNNTLSRCDNSPTFLKDPVAFACLNQLDQINQGGSDADGDSIAYQLVPSQINATTNVTYLGGYSATTPLSVTGTFGFNPGTGQLSFTPNQTQVGVLKILVSEYRGGVLIGTVERDLQIVVQACNDTLPNISNATGSTVVASTTALITACTSACFNITTSSPSTSPTVALTMTVAGLNNTPGATFVITPGRFPSAVFCWTPTRANAGTHNIFVTVKDNACPNPGQVTKTYTIIVPEVYPAGPDQTICQYNTVNAQATGNGVWTIMSGNPTTTTIANTTSPTTLISGFTLPGRYNYIWVSDTICRDTMSIFVTSKPNAGVDQTICQNSIATMAATGSGVWHALSTNPATTVITDTFSATTTISGFTTVGTYGYIRTSNSCSDTVNVIVSALPNAGPDQTVCTSTGIVTMAATGTGTWTAAASNPVATTITSPTSPTTNITGLLTSGVYTYYWGSSCLDTVKINITTRSNGGPDQTICQNNTVKMGAVGTGTWTVVPGNPAATTIVSPTNDSTVITGFTVAGIYNFVWSTGTGCGDTVKVTVNPLPNAGPDQTACLYNVITMAATGTGTWTALGSNPAVTTIANTASPTTTVSGFSVAGIYTYVWASNGCTDTVLITINAKPNAGADQTICQYTSTTMTATGTGTWTAAASNPAAVSFVSTTSPTTSVSGFTTAGTYTFYWSLNGCSDTVLINVTAKPNAGTDQTICQYSTTAMTATGTGTWTSAASNPAAVSFVSTTSPTTAVSGFTAAGTYTFYWSLNGCSDTVLINVTAKPNAGTDQIICQYTSTAMTATGTGTWTSAASNPTAVSFVSTISPTTSVSGFTAAGTYTFYWSLNGCSDTVLINVTAKPNAGADQTICQYSTTAMTATGTGTWTAAASNPVAVSFVSTTSPTTSVSGFTTAGTYTFYWSQNGCSDTVLINVTAKPNAGTDQTICQYTSSAMTATGTGTWTSAASNPAAVSFVSTISPTTSVSGFTAAGTYTFYWSLNGCSDTVLINVTAKPNAGADQTICQYSTTAMTATGTGTWTAAASNPVAVSFVSTTSPTTSVSGFTTAGTYTFYWSQNGCSDTVLINVTAKPNAGTDQTICQYTSTTMTATGTGTWTSAASNPAAVSFVSTTSPTTAVSGFTAAGTYTFYWSLNGCSDTVLINVTAKPDAGPDQTICQFTSASMAATGTGTWTPLAPNTSGAAIFLTNSPTSMIGSFRILGTYGYIWTNNGCSDTVFVTVKPKPNAGPDQTICQYSTTALAATGTGTWTAAVTNPAIISFVNDTSPISTASGFTAPGTYTLYWSLNGCQDIVLINVTAKPNAGADQIICQYSTTAMTATGTGTWTSAASNPAAVSFVSTTSPTTALSGFTAAGTYTFYWSQNGCSDTVLINVTAKPNAGSDQTICQYTSTAMTATGTGTWTSAASNPAAVSFVNTTSPTTSVSGFTTAGTYTFYWSQNGCSDTVLINVTAKPNAGTDQTICQYSTTAMTATGTGTWTSAASNPAAVSFVSTTSPTTSISGFTSAGTYTFYWSLNGCTDTVLINVTAKPNAGTDQTICQYTSTTMTATGTGTWTAAASNPAAVSFVNTTSPTTSVSGFTSAGTYTFYWSQNGCSDTVLINVTAKPNAGIDQTICQYSTTAMTATGTGTWTSAASNPAAVSFVSATSPTTSLSGFTSAGTYTFYWSLNGCTDTVLINVTAKPNAGPDQSLCAPGIITTAGIGAGIWSSLVTNPGTSTITNVNNAITTISGFIAGGTYTYIRTYNGCSDSMNVLVIPINSAGPDQTICQYNTTSTAAFGNGTWSALSSNPASTAIANPSADTTLISGFILPGAYGYIWNSITCTDTFYVNVTAKPNAGPDQTTCQYSGVSMAAIGSGTWTSLASNPVATTITTPSSPTTTISGFTIAGLYTYVWTSNGCSDTATVNVIAKPNAGADITICQYNNATMAATGTGTWTSVPSNPAPTTISTPSSATTSITGFSTAGTYTYIWSLNGCSDSVNVIVTAKPNAGADQTTCQFSSATMAASGTGTWTAQAGNPATATIASPSSPSTTVSGFTIAGTYNFIWTANGCSDTASVIVTAKPNAGPDQTICQYTSTVLSATGSGSWTAPATNPAAVTFTSAISPISSVSGFSLPGIYTLIWTVNGCSDSVLINVTAKPNAGPDQTTCQYSTVTMAATGSGIWTAQSGNPSPASITTLSSATTSIRGFTVAGTYNFIWTANGCTDTASVTVLAKPNAGPDQTICQYTSTVLAATGTGTWSSASGNPAPLTFVSSTSPATVVSGFSIAGTYTLIWTNNGCSDSVLINVTAKPNAGPDQTTCQFSTAAMAASGTGTWTALSTNPSSTSFTNATSPTTSISGFILPGTYSYIWTSNGCTDTANVTVIPKPNAGTDQTICQYSSAVMAATGTGTWSSLPGNPSPLTFVSITSPSTSVSGFTLQGIYTLIWSSNGCSDTMLVNVTPKPNAGSDQTICQFSTATMTATGTGSWTSLSSNPAITVITNPTLPTTGISGFGQAGTYGFVWTLNGCSDTANVIVTAKPNAGTDQSFCLPGTTTLNAASGPGIWTALSTNPVSNIVNPGSSSSLVNGFSAGGYYSYIWTVNGCADTTIVTAFPTSPAGPDQTICQYNSIVTAGFGSGTWLPLSSNPTAVSIANPSADTTVISGFNVPGVFGFIWSVSPCVDTLFITVTAKPDAGTDQTICQYSNTVMTATGSGTWTSSASNPAVVSFANNTSPTSLVSGFTASGTYTFYWSLNGCSDTVLIHVTAKPNAGADQTLCQYSIATMTATGAGTWTADASNPAVVTFSNASSPTSTITGLNIAGTYTFYWSLNGCSDTVLINITAKPNAGSDQTFCQYSNTVMTATGSGTWTSSASNPAVVSFANNTSPTSLVSGFTASGTYTFYWSLNGCSDTVLIHVTAKPNAGTDQTLCQYSIATMTATGAGTWTADASDPAVVTFSNALSPTSTITGLNIAGTYTFYWSLNGCSDTVLINITAKPNAGADQTFCQYSNTVMTATGSGTWTSSASNPAVVSFANNTSPTSSASGFTASGTYTFYWSLNGCSDTVLIHVTAKPNAGADQTLCQYSIATMTATGAGTWTADASNPAVVTFSNASSPTSTITGLNIAGTYTFYWSLNGCSDTVLINITAKPNAGSDQTLCLPGTITTAASAGPGTWTALPGNPATSTINSPNSPTTVISGFTTGGVYSYVWTVNGCSDTMNVSIIPVSPAGPDQTICQYNSISTAAFGNGVWTILPANPAATTIANLSSDSTTISGFTVAGTYSFAWTVNGCTDTINVIVISKPDAGSDQTICQYSSSAFSATGSGTWTADASNPALVTIANTSSPTSSVSGFTASGTYTFYWSLNGCSDTVLINVTAKPNAGTDQTICQYSSTSLSATGTGIWTADASNPALVTIANTSSPTSSVSGFTASGIYVFYWSLNGCSDTALINVTAKPNAGADQTICQYSSTSLSATGTGTWTASASNPAVVSFGNNTSPTSPISGFTASGTYTLYWSLNGCSDTVLINVTAKPNAGTDQTICQYSSTALSATGSGTWTADASNPALVTIANTTSPTSSISGFTASGIYTFYWSLNGCSDTVLINVTAKPNAGADQTICQYSSTSLSATGTGTWTASASNPAVVSFANNTSPTSPISGFTASGTYTLYWSLNGCSDTVLINVTAKPNAGTDQTICQYSGTAFSATGSGTWTADASNPALVTIANTTSPTSSISGFTASGTYIFYWSLNGCSDTVLINVTAKPNAGADQTICQYSSTSLSATGTGTWTASASNPAVVSFGNNTSPTSPISGFTASGTYTLYWSLNGCSDTVLINVTAKPNAGTDQTICQYSSTALSATGSGTWIADASNPALVTIANTSSPTSSLSGFTASGTYTFYWSLNGCSDTVLINVTAKPNAGPDQAICQNSTATMAATGLGAWTSLSSNPAATIISNATSANTSVSGFSIPGAYSFVWTNNGCADTMNVNVSQASTLSINSIAPVCVGQTDTLTATVSVPGGVFAWSPGAGNTQSIIVSPSSTTTFTVTYTIPVCGTYTDSVTAVIYPLLSLTTQNDTICNGTSAILATIPSTPGGTYLWSPGGFTSASITVSPNTSTVYTVTYSHAGCISTSVSDTVNVTIPPTLTLNNATVCFGDSTILTATPSQTGGLYSWSPGAQTTQSITVAPSATTTYTVSYAIPNSVCPPTTASAAVTVTPQPTLSVNDTTICEGRSGTLTAVPSISGGTYLWSSGSSTTQSITVSPLTTSTYTVAYTIAGCGTAIDSGTVTVLPLPVLMVNDDTICRGQTATLTATASRPGGTYAWSPSSGGTQTIAVSPQTSTTYTVSYLLSGCNAVIDSGKVRVDIPYILTGVGSSICEYQSATISVTPSITGGNFVWTPGGAATSTITVSPDSTTVYTAAYVIPQSVCPSVSLQDTVLVTPLPHVTISGDTICKGLSTVITALPSQTGGTYLWTPGTATTQSINVTPAVTTDYIVAYTLAMCPAVYDTATITVTLPPAVTVSVQNGDCGVNDGALWAIVNGGVPGYSYLWSDSLHTRTDTLTGLYANNSYTVTVTDHSQCVVTASGTVGLTTVPLVIIEDTLADISCHGYNNGLIEIHAVSCPTCQYFWSNQQTTPTITGLSAGIYSVTVKDGFGCSDTASYTITDPVSATLGILPIDTTIVEGAAVDLTNVFGPYPASAITTYSWSPSVGLSCVDCPSPVFSSTAGTYHYTLVINYNQSCHVSDTVTIVVESEHIVYIPNSFTPNGDGINDVFLVFPRGVKFINLNIFDRWGELVFESQDEAHGWDGRFKGEMMPPGVYVYQTDITFNDGYTLHNKGSITLIR